MILTRATAVLVGLATLSLAACSDDSTDEPSAAVSTTTTVADPPTSTTANSTSTTIGAELPDGQHVGYIARLQVMDDGFHYWLYFDLAYLLTGDEATAAASEAGVDLDTDYYIQNDNPRVRLTRFASEVVSTVVGEGDACCDSVEIPFGQFLQRVDAASDDDASTSEGPLMRITIDDGLVTRIDEVYLS